VTYIIQELVENRDGNTWADNLDFYIVPVVNPDGYEYTHSGMRLWRKNRKDPQLGRCAGTDLNRNFGYKWGGAGSSKDRCQEIYAGSAPFSEPETQAIRDFVTNLGASVRVRHFFFILQKTKKKKYITILKRNIHILYLIVNFSGVCDIP
jgi:carboxypeptidase A4